MPDSAVNNTQSLGFNNASDENLSSIGQTISSVNTVDIWRRRIKSDRAMQEMNDALLAYARKILKEDKLRMLAEYSIPVNIFADDETINVQFVEMLISTLSERELTKIINDNSRLRQTLLNDLSRADSKVEVLKQKTERALRSEKGNELNEYVSLYAHKQRSNFDVPASREEREIAEAEEENKRRRDIRDKLDRYRRTKKQSALLFKDELKKIKTLIKTMNADKKLLKEVRIDLEAFFKVGGASYKNGALHYNPLTELDIYSMANDMGIDVDAYYGIDKSELIELMIEKVLLYVAMIVGRAKTYYPGLIKDTAVFMKILEQLSSYELIMNGYVYSDRNKYMIETIRESIEINRKKAREKIRRKKGISAIEYRSQGEIYDDSKGPGDIIERLYKSDTFIIKTLKDSGMSVDELKKFLYDVNNFGGYSGNFDDFLKWWKNSPIETILDVIVDKLETEILNDQTKIDDAKTKYIKSKTSQIDPNILFSNLALWTGNAKAYDEQMKNMMDVTKGLVKFGKNDIKFKSFIDDLQTRTNEEEAIIKKNKRYYYKDDNYESEINFRRKTRHDLEKYWIDEGDKLTTNKKEINGLAVISEFVYKRGIKYISVKNASPVYVVNKDERQDYILESLEEVNLFLRSKLPVMLSSFVTVGPIPGVTSSPGAMAMLGLGTADSVAAAVLKALEASHTPTHATGGSGRYVGGARTQFISGGSLDELENVGGARTQFISGDSLDGLENREKVSIDWNSKTYTVKPIPHFASGGSQSSTKITEMSQSERKSPMAVGITTPVASYKYKTNNLENDDNSMALKVINVSPGIYDPSPLHNNVSAMDVLIAIQTLLTSMNQLSETDLEIQKQQFASLTAIGKSLSKSKTAEISSGGFTSSLDKILSGS